MRQKFFQILWIVIAFILLTALTSAMGDDLPQIKKRGVLRHLGIPYANFVTGTGNGLDVEMVKLFAREIRVKYEFVRTEWSCVIDDLCGKKLKVVNGNVIVIGDTPVKGDIIATGLTVLPWRQKMVNYSKPTFPTQIWLVARADSSLTPIKPSNDMNKDINAVKSQLKGVKVMGVAKTCLDPDLYGLKETGAKIILFKGNLNEIVPAIIKGDSEAAILDVPDLMIALEKWPGKIKVIGPVSHRQDMGYAFSKDAIKLRDEFNRFFEKTKKDGTYLNLVKKYYPSVFQYYPDFFKY